MSTQSFKPLLASLSAAAMMSVTTLACAGDPPSYSELDENSDGTISKQEAKAHDKLARQFDQVDTDADGVLGWSEFSRFESEGKAEDSGIRQVPQGNNTGLQPDDGMN